MHQQQSVPASNKIHSSSPAADSVGTAAEGSVDAGQDLAAKIPFEQIQAAEGKGYRHLGPQDAVHLQDLMKAFSNSGPIRNQALAIYASNEVRLLCSGARVGHHEVRKFHQKH